MKTFVILLVVCSMASIFGSPIELNEEQKVKAKQHLEICSQEEKVSEEDVKKFSNKDFTNPSKEFKCLTTCFFEKAGTLKASEVQQDVVLAKLGVLIGEDKAKEILEKCKGIKGDDRCETGFKIFQCFQDAQEKQH